MPFALNDKIRMRRELVCCGVVRAEVVVFHAFVYLTSVF